MRTTVSTIVIIVLVAASLTAGYGIGKLAAGQDVKTETISATSTMTTTSVSTLSYVSTTTDYSTANSPPPGLYTSQTASVVLTSMTTKGVLQNPGGPTFNTTIVNNSNQAVTNVTLIFFSEHILHFDNITAQSPLKPGASSSREVGFIGPSVYFGPFPGPTYPIMVVGTFQDGQAFAFLESIEP